MAHSHKITDDDKWLEARRSLMEREKELTRLRDEVNALRRDLPWRRIEAAYRFEGPQGERSLTDLFDGQRQLIIYHFMYGPDWDAGCPSCSFWADHFDAMAPHLRARNTAFAAVSRASVETLATYAKRLGWSFPWFHAQGDAFNRDFAVSFSPEQGESKDPLYNFGTLPVHGTEMPGASVFVREGDEIFHTYSTYARGLDILNGTYHWLDMTPLGRDEAELPWPMAWVKRNDEYAK